MKRKGKEKERNRKVRGKEEDRKRKGRGKEDERKLVTCGSDPSKWLCTSRLSTHRKSSALGVRLLAMVSAMQRCFRGELLQGLGLEEVGSVLSSSCSLSHLIPLSVRDGLSLPR